MTWVLTPLGQFLEAFTRVSRVHCELFPYTLESTKVPPVTSFLPVFFLVIFLDVTKRQRHRRGRYIAGPDFSHDAIDSECLWLPIDGGVHGNSIQKGGGAAAFSGPIKKGRRANANGLRKINAAAVSRGLPSLKCSFVRPSIAAAVSRHCGATGARAAAATAFHGVFLLFAASSALINLRPETDNRQPWDPRGSCEGGERNAEERERRKEAGVALPGSGDCAPL